MEAGFLGATLQHMKIQKVVFSRDRNGNKTVKIIPRQGRAFSIQTLGNLPLTHRGLDSFDSAALAEIETYIETYGTAKQKEAVK
jgi:hypothetical protein